MLIRHGWASRSRAMRQRERILERRQERTQQAILDGDRPAAAGAAWSRWSLLLGKLLGLAALLAVSGLLYDAAASPTFRVHQVTVRGIRLLSADEVLNAAAVQGTNVFWLRRSEVAERVARLPAARNVEVQVSLPDRVDVIVHERSPYVSWQAGDATYLVDRDGMVLGTQVPEEPLIVIRDQDALPLQAGQRVDLIALRTVAALSERLPGALGIAPAEYDYSRSLGIEVQGPSGTRVRFGSDEAIEAKVATLVALSTELARLGERPALVDLRFPSRPYYR
jgi:cell division septal protein FtsQ